MNKIVVFDNGGETLDRFSILDLNSGDMYGASLDPFHPLGFGQYCGNPAHQYFCTTIGSPFMSNMSKRDPNHYARIIKRKTAEIVQEFKDGGNLGKVVDFQTLPAPVKQYCKQLFEPQTALI